MRVSAAWMHAVCRRAYDRRHVRFDLPGEQRRLCDRGAGRSVHAEAELQELLAGNIHLLPGAQINRDNPRRWLLIKREAGVPDREGGGGWWSIDHLAVDQDAVPTFIEVKRASDTRARREVVAQMLDYAANGSAFWTAGQLHAWFEGNDPQGATERLVAWLDPSGHLRTRQCCRCVLAGGRDEPQGRPDQAGLRCR